MGGVLQHSCVRCRQSIEAGLQARHGVQPRMTGGFALPRFGHAVGRQPREAGANVQLFSQFVLGPRFDFFKPGLEVTSLHLAPIDALACNALVTDREQLVRPLLPWHLELEQRSATFLQTLDDQLGRLLAFSAFTLAGEQTS